MDSLELRSECLALCRVSSALDSKTLVKLEQIVEALKRHMEKKATLFLEKHQHSPLLVSYAADATPLLVNSTSSMKSLSTGSTRRSGRHLVEFLMQTCFYKAKNATGDMEMVITLTDPKPLTKGKRGWNLFSAACDFLPLLRRRGHKAICVQHMAADRAVFSSLDRHLRGRQSAFYDPQHGPDLGTEAPLLQSTDWMVSNPCAVHDAHNGLQWGLSALTDATTLDDLHIVVESIRNTFASLREHIPAFLHQNLRCHEPPQPATDEVRMVWALLGVEPSWIEHIASLNPVWSGGCLYINDCEDQEQSTIEQVSHLFFYLMRWRKFTQSRWGSIGTSCRALVATTLLGLPTLVSMTRADPHVSDYHLRGFERLSPKVMEFAIAAAAASYPMENFILAMLHDDRLLSNLTVLEEDLAEEMHYLDTLPLGVWERLASIEQTISPYGLQNSTLHAAHTSLAYLHEKTLRQTRLMPWSLCLGNVDFNLHELAVLVTPPEEQVARKIWHLLRSGYPQREIHEAVTLLKEVPWSTQGVERSHGSLASLHKYHPQYSLATLAARATLHQCRALFSENAEQVALQKHQEEIAKLQRSLARSVSARNVFLAELASTVSTTTAQRRDQPSSPQDLVRLSHKLYEQLDDFQKLQYEAKAAEATSSRQASLLQVQDSLTQSFLLQTQRQRQEQKEVGVLNTLASCRFTQDDYEALHTLLAEPGLAGPALQRLRHRCLEAPEEPPPPTKLVFQQAYEADPVATQENDAQPEWIKTVCRNREYFAQGLFLHLTDLQHLHEGFVLVVASQSPLKAVFLRVELHLPMLDCTVGSALGKGIAKAQEWFNWEFTICPLNYVVSSDIPLPHDSEEILWLDNMQFVGEGKLVSDSRPMRLASVISRLGLPSKPRPDDENHHQKQRKRKAEQHLPDFPWLQAHIAESRQTSRPTSTSSQQTSRRPALNDPPQPEPQPLDLAEVWQQLEEKRLEWADTGLSDAFYLQVRGGAWTAAHRQVAFDSLMAAAKKGVASEWAKRFHMGQVITFSYNLYSEEAAHKMAEAWIRKCQHFFDLCVERGSLDTPIPQQELGAYADADFDAWVDALPPGSAVAKRAAKVQTLMPRLA